MKNNHKLKHYRKSKKNRKFSDKSEETTNVWEATKENLAKAWSAAKDGALRAWSKTKKTTEDITFFDDDIDDDEAFFEEENIINERGGDVHHSYGFKMDGEKFASFDETDDETIDADNMPYIHCASKTKEHSRPAEK